MRLLDVKHAEGQKQRTDKPNAGIIEPPADEEDEHDREHIRDGRQSSPHKVHPVIAGLAHNLAHELGHHHWKQAIDISAVAVVVWVQGVDGRVKVLAE